MSDTRGADVGWTVPGYEAVRTLGRGAGGRVVLARHEATGVPVAVKYLSERLHGDRDFLARFRAEARLLGELRHPCVVRLYEYVEARRGAAIVMEAVDGVALRALLREHGSTGPEAALVLLKGSLLGLGAAHAAGVVHRDYKPENVLVRADGSSALADFGIAVRVGRETEAAGTPAYMAPEQWDGEPATPAGDVYAATAVFYECLTGRQPFVADDLIALRLQHLRAPVEVADVPDPVRDLVRTGLAKDPADRPGIDALLAGLERAATDGYGADWEERGRRGLGRLAALLALLFPFGTTAAVYEATPALTVLGRLKGVLGRTLVGAAVLAVVAAGAATVATAGTADDTTTTAADSVPSGTSASGVPAPSSSSLPPSDSPTPSGSPSGSASAEPTPSDSTTAPATDGTPTTAAPGPGPTATTPAPGGTAPTTPAPTTTTPEAPTAGTVTIVIGSLRRGPGSTLIADVTVDTTGTGPLTLTADFSADSPAESYGSQSRQLSGSTQYSVTFQGDFANHPCRGTWTIAVSSSPQSPGGTRTASADAPPC
ncbi:serine/threonine-protein kinase [Streptomyces sp. NPDC127166]|uniref:serine/threonine-protein kinase n=1 Tax=Streptomyces sp. NPDC127166 TaxID=3345380 RepID=UPI00362F9037